MSMLMMSSPIFDRRMEVQAYLLRYRSVSDGASSGAPSVLDSLRSAGLDAFSSVKPLFVPANARTLLAEEPFFAAAKVALLLEEDVRPVEPYFTEVAKLRSSGLKIAAMGEQPTNMLRVLNYIFYDHSEIEQSNSLNAHHSTVRSHHPDIITIAQGLVDGHAHKRAKAEGYGLFEGRFYLERPTDSVTKLPQPKAQLINIINGVREKDFDLEKVANMVETNQALSGAMLRFINSPHILGDREEIISAHHAIVVLGQDEVRKWLSAAVLRTLGEQGKPEELIRLSLVRARLCELLAPDFGLGDFAQDLFLLGLFSLVDIILEVKMQQAAQMIMLPTEVQSALTQGGGRFFPVLSFVQQYEQAQWRTVMRYASSYNLDLAKISKAYIDALRWYNELLLGSRPAARRA